MQQREKKQTADMEQYECKSVKDELYDKTDYQLTFSWIYIG
jgi:hypothetical protein